MKYYFYVFFYFLPPACIWGPAFICPYRPRPRLLSEARPLIESRSLFEDLRYLCTFLRRTESRYALRSNDFLHLVSTRTETGRVALSFFAPSAWNTFQSELKIANLLPLEAFRSIKKKTMEIF